MDVYVGEGIGMYFGIVLSGESVPQVGGVDGRELELWFGWGKMKTRKV